MNKAFEKILERLEENKSIIPVNRVLDDIIKDKPKELGQLIAYDNSIKIVQEVAEEYKDGWTPCSERLPEEYTVLCCDKYGEMIVGHPYFDEVSNTNYSAESDNEMMYNCVAWQPLPEPFKESD